MSTKKHIEKLQKLLDSTNLTEHIKVLEEITGKTKAVEQLLLENENRIATKLKQMGLSRYAKGEDVYLAAFNQIEQMNDGIRKALGNPDYSSQEGLAAIMNRAFDEVNHDPGWFIKEEKAKEMLIKVPPEQMLKFTKFASVEEMLDVEPVKEVMSIMRFSETGKWMHTFLQQYNELEPEDFESREIELIILDPEKWYEAAREFIQKKKHNMSHLKEMGVIFGMPEKSLPMGQTLKIFQLTIHYYFEVHMYADFFSSVGAGTLGANLVKVLQADISDPPQKDQKEPYWRIIQRYLRKDSEPDPRIFQPHVNSEVLHWRLATDRFIELDDVFPGLGISTWDNLDHVADYFPSKHNEEIFVNFNFEDNVLSCCEFLPATGSYFYHYKEDMWNAIFDTFFSDQTTRSIIFQNMARGYVTPEDLRHVIR